MVDKITKDEFRLLKSILSKLEEKFVPDFKEVYLQVLQEINIRMKNHELKKYASRNMEGVSIYAKNEDYAYIILFIVRFLEMKIHADNEEDEEDECDKEINKVLCDTKSQIDVRVSLCIAEELCYDINISETYHSLCSAKTIDEIICAYY